MRSKQASWLHNHPKNSCCSTWSKRFEREWCLSSDASRYGEVISTAFVESTVNQVISKRMVKKQQMRWTKQGAHLLLQVRTQVLNADLRPTFEQWYPAMVSTDVPSALAA
jgi:hypothetical protein